MFVALATEEPPNLRTCIKKNLKERKNVKESRFVSSLSPEMIFDRITPKGSLW
jgi:hypothetical protein